MRALHSLSLVVGMLLLPVACGSSNDLPEARSAVPDSLCDSACDSSPLAVPVLEGDSGYGAVTTYGNVSSPEYSSGGACNYGSTTLQFYAAAHLDLEPGDGAGLWQGGHACGDCYKVQVGSDTGWRSVVVRIVDKCPDAYCGIDLGGAPAQALMGGQPGRYTGKWQRVSCTESAKTYDGSTVLHVKEGSNAWWSLVQVRNGPSAATAIAWESLNGSTSGTFAWATEAENFWKVPQTILDMDSEIRLVITFRNNQRATLILPGNNLSTPGADWNLVME